MHVRDNTEATKPRGKPEGTSDGKLHNQSAARESQGWGWFFLKIVLLIIAVVGAYVGFTVYRASQRSSRF